MAKLPRSRHATIRRSNIRLALAVVFGAGLAFPGRALAVQESTHTFVATVFDAVTGLPVAAAFAAALGTESWAVTDHNGSFRLELPRGRHTIRVWRLGYTPTMFALTLDTAAVAVLDAPLVLTPVPVAMPELVVEGDRTALVSGPLGDFQRRRREERGRFYTREQIELRNPETLADMLRDVPGVDVQYLGGLRSTIRLAGHCTPAYYVDGIQSNEPLALAIRPERLDGVEVYRRPSEIPPELNAMGAGCGVIVLWTRR